jgi:hypothetical protein
MKNSNPGQNEKPDIVRNEQKMFPPSRSLPSDEPIPVFDLEGSAGPAQTGNDLAIEKGQVPQMLPNQSGPPEVMIVINQVVPQITLAGSHQPQGGFTILAKGALQRGIGEQGNLNKGRPF